MTRRRLHRTAMPQSWRPVTDYKVEQFGDVVITTEIVNPSKSSRYYNIYTYGQLFGTAHSLADAKYQVEVIYGPLRWHRQPNPPVEVIHYYFGRTTEFTEPTTIYTADLPMLGYAASRRAEATRRGVYGEQSTATHRRIYRGLSVPKPRGFQDRWLKLNFGTKSISEEEDFANWQRMAEQILRDIQSGRNEYWSEDQSVSVYFAKSLRHNENSIPILLTGWLSRGDESYAYTQSYDDRTTFSDEGEITLFDRQTVEVDGAYLIRDGGSASQPLLTLTLFSTQSPSSVIRMSASRRTAYQLTHRPAQDGAPLHDLTQMFPPDVYTHPHYYSFGGDEMGERKTHGIIREYRDEPDKPITIYRAVPDGVMSINTGDWVTITREYAAFHALHPTDPEQDYPIISATVPARTLLNGGNDLLEWGYWGPTITGRTASRPTASRKTAGKTYYHGTPFILRLGDTILPASKNLMRHRNFDMSREDRIYLTDDIGEAYWWAAMASVGAPFKVFPAVYRVDNVENPQVSSAMGQFELLAESAEVVEDVTEQAKAAWLAKGSNRYQQVVNMGGIEDSPRNRGYFLIASRNATRKTGNYLTELDPHIQHPDTRYALNLITEALATLPDPHALSLAKQVRIYLAGKPNPDSEKEQAIQRFLIRYADKIIKSHGDQPAASVPNYQSRELQQAWNTLTPHL